MHSPSIRFFLLQTVASFVPIVAIWVYTIDSAFFAGMDMIGVGQWLGYAIVFGVILSAVGLWGLFQMILKSLFPDAYEDSISFHKFHLLCGGVGCILCGIFFIQFQIELAALFVVPVAVSYYLYQKCLRVERQHAS